MFGYLKRSYDLMGASIHSPYADYILAFLFYLEAIFFLPTDPILIIYCLERRDRAITYATIATLASVLGGITSYMLGSMLWNYAGESMINNYYVNCILTPSMFHKLSYQFQQHEWGAIFLAGFTPIPYKAATLAAGFCKLSLVPFICCSIIARGARFYLFAIVCKWYGPRIKDSITKYFNLILLLMLVLIAISVWLFT